MSFKERDQHVETEGRLRLLLGQGRGFKGRSDDFNDGERAGTDPKTEEREWRGEVGKEGNIRY